MKKYIQTILAASLLMALTGCSPQINYSDGIESPAQTPTETSPGDSNTIDLGEGDRSVTIDLPDFTDPGEEGEPSSESWKEFAKIADDSKFRLLSEGGSEYFGMYDESYFMLYDPEFPAGKNWVVYYLESDETVQIGYDVFEMAAFNSGMELFIYGNKEDRALSGSEVSKNPDGSYTVRVPELEYSLRYNVENGYIIGRAVWDGTSDIFMGYSNITYGLSENDKATVRRAYELAQLEGESFEKPAEDKFLTDYYQGSALTGFLERTQ